MGNTINYSSYIANGAVDNRCNHNLFRRSESQITTTIYVTVNIVFINGWRGGGLKRWISITRKNISQLSTFTAIHTKLLHRTNIKATRIQYIFALALTSSSYTVHVGWGVMEDDYNPPYKEGAHIPPYHSRQRVEVHCAFV